MSCRRLLVVGLATLCSLSAATAGELANRFRDDAGRLVATITADSSLYRRVAEFCDRYPRRLSGTEILGQGLSWIEFTFRREGWNVRSQPIMVPNWKRGSEYVQMVSPTRRQLPMLGLGGSIGTNGRPLRGKVLVVKDFDDLKKNADRVKGKIVVYNIPFTDYGATVRYRYSGAVEAARYGAIASLVRSVGPYGIQTPHTGAMGYDSTVPKIPAAAITMEDAMQLQRIQDRGEESELELSMSAHWEPDAPSRNLVIEIPGTEHAGEVVVMGGHIDAWDVGQGAMDDAGGCFAAWRALAAIRDLGLKPRRTIRVVFWTNEENGLRGGKAYADSTKHERHVLAIESDEGTFAPQGFTAKAPAPLMKKLQDAVSLLTPIGVTYVKEGDGGADIGPLEQRGTPVMSLQVDGSRYFWYHHTEGDTIDKLDPKELNHCAAALAVITWCMAND